MRSNDPDNGRTMNRRDFLKMASIAGGAIALTGVPDAFALSPKRITIATAGIGSVYFALGGAIARTLTHYTGLETVAEITSGRKDNCDLVGSKRSDLGLIAIDMAYDAFRGAGMFEGKPVPIRVLTALYPSYTHIVTLKNKQITSVKDLAGRPVAIGITSSATYNTARHLIEAAGIGADNDIKAIAMASSESPRSLKNGKIDAYISTGGIPDASVAGLFSTPGLAAALVSHGDLVPTINAKYGPVYYRSLIPRTTYPGMKEDISVCAFQNIMICHRDMDNHSAYNILKIIFEHLEEISPIHSNAKLSLETGASLTALPYHSGAQKFFAERGFAVP
jgi:uncharacterized protein